MKKNKKIIFIIIAILALLIIIYLIIREYAISSQTLFSREKYLCTTGQNINITGTITTRYNYAFDLLLMEKIESYILKTDNNQYYYINNPSKIPYLIRKKNSNVSINAYLCPDGARNPYFDATMTKGIAKDIEIINIEKK